MRPDDTPPSSPLADELSEDRFAQAEEEYADHANELRMLERELSHDIYETVQTGNETALARESLWLRLLVLLHQHPEFTTFLEIPSRQNDGLESSPAQGVHTDVSDLQ